MTIRALKSPSDQTPLTGMVVSAVDRVGNESARIGLAPLGGSKP
jgi:hypothetical protein